MVFPHSSTLDLSRLYSVILGPLLLGAFFNAVFYGAIIVQAVSYFQTFPKDRLSLKVFVTYLVLVETLSTGFDMFLAYEPLILLPSDEAITKVPTMLATVGAVTVFISTPVQIYLALRLRVVLRSPILPWLVILLSWASFAGGMATSINTALARTFAGLATTSWAPILWLASSALADALITVGLCHFLYKSKSGLPLDSVVNRIIRTTIQTGGLTAVAATADFIVFLTAKGAYNFIWDLALAKLYTNALLSTLNARKAWNELIEEQRRSMHFSFIDVNKALGTTSQPSSSSA